MTLPIGKCTICTAAPAYWFGGYFTDVEDIIESMCYECFMKWITSDEFVLWRDTRLANQGDLAEFIYLEYVRHARDTASSTVTP